MGQNPALRWCSSGLTQALSTIGWPTKEKMIRTIRMAITASKTELGSNSGILKSLLFLPLSFQQLFFYLFELLVYFFIASSEGPGQNPIKKESKQDANKEVSLTSPTPRNTEKNTVMTIKTVSQTMSNAKPLMYHLNQV